jgi:hypothetical protein
MFQYHNLLRRETPRDFAKQRKISVLLFD